MLISVYGLSYSATQPTEEDYRVLVDEIFGDVIALQEQKNYLMNMNEKEHISKSSKEFRFQLRFESGKVGDLPNPNWQPNKKGSRTIPQYEDDGVNFNLMLYFGPWRGTAMVQPVNIGKLNIVLFTSGPKGDEVHSLIDNIVGKKKSEFLNKFKL